MRVRTAVLALFLAPAAPLPSFAQAPVEYRLSFAEAEHRLMDVEVRFRDIPAGPLELRMSRSSPGRYALHEFAKNVFAVRVTSDEGVPLPVARPNPYQWTVTAHTGQVRVAYRVFGDRVDGTYLGIDSTHAHINMPAALMWARGFELRPATLTFDLPSGAGWRVGTQLFPGPGPATYTAPNLYYLMDSPTELSAFGERTFTISDAPGEPRIRLVVHHTGTDAELDAFAAAVERIVREARHVFGEYPAFEGNTYTFIADYLPWANGDGMEHRNSTVLTSAGSLRSNRSGLLDTVAHEFFHGWNVERIRPRSLEPFDLDNANMSGELWLAEGFTNYYGPLISLRAGVSGIPDFVGELSHVVNALLTNPGRALHSAEEMSRLAPFVDAATSIDRTAFANTFLSYYTFGQAIGLGLDLSLRARSNGAVTLDHFMRALWLAHGKPGGTVPGTVDRPYTMTDLEAALASASGDPAFARDFFARYIQGREAVDYATLLARAGLLLRRVSPGRAFAGDIQLRDVQGRPRVADAVPFGSPAYAAGLDRDDVILAVAGKETSSAVDVEQAIRAARPGDQVPIVFERRGARVGSTLRLVEDPHVEVVRFEDAGRALTADQRQFRDAWLGSAAGRRF
jgi:predicted metalloprotease with PDZ domain